MRALRSLREKQNAGYLYLTQRTQRDKVNGKVKSASKREQSNSFELPSDSRFEKVKTENFVKRSKEQEVQDRTMVLHLLGIEGEGLKRKTENYPPPSASLVPLSQGDSWLRGVQENWERAEKSE